jgi:hypothetical protein
VGDPLTATGGALVAFGPLSISRFPRIALIPAIPTNWRMALDGSGH